MIYTLLEDTTPSVQSNFYAVLLMKPAMPCSPVRRPNRRARKPNSQFFVIRVGVFEKPRARNLTEQTKADVVVILVAALGEEAQARTLETQCAVVSIKCYSDLVPCAAMRSAR